MIVISLGYMRPMLYIKYKGIDFMKARLLMIASLTLNISILCNGNVLKISEKKISLYKEELAADLSRNSWIRLATKSAFGVTALAACYTMFKGFSIVQNSELNALREQAGKNAGRIEYLAALIKEGGVYAIDDDVFERAFSSSTNGWGTFLANTAVSLGCSAAFNFASQKVLSHIFFDPDIQWFMQKETSLPAIYQEIEVLQKEVIKHVKNGTYILTTYQCQKYVDQIIRLHNKFVDATERLGGFFAYKIQTNGLKLFDIQYLVNCINDNTIGVVQKMEDALGAYNELNDENKSNKAVCTMFDIVQQFGAELNVVISSFVTLESHE